MAWWSRPKPDEAPPEPEIDDLEPEEWEPAGDDDDEPQDQPDEIRESRLERALQERAQVLRGRFAEKGIDISEDGEPVIRDPRRFGEWARPAVGAARSEAPRRPEPAPEPPAPEPAMQPETASGADRVGKDLEVWEMTPEILRSVIREEAQKIAKPVLDQVQQQRSLLGKRFVDEATQRAADALQTMAPDYMHILDHPQFEELFREQLSQMPPEWLDSPQVIASTAMGLIPWMDKDQMPDRKINTAEPAARAAVNRSLVPNSRPVLEAAAPADYYGTASRWLESKGLGKISAQELEALDATDERGVHTFDAYMTAKRRMDRSKGKG